MSSSSSTLKATASILKILPPWESARAFDALRSEESTLSPEAMAEIEEKLVQVPLKPRMDDTAGRSFLQCSFNRFGESYRSPWSNTLIPPIPNADDAIEQALFTLESQVNEVWDAYRQLYYGHDAVGSVYLKEAKDGFAGCFLLQKETSNGGCWTSVHLVSVATGGTTSKYTIHSTIHVTMKGSDDDDDNSISLMGARVSKDKTETSKVSTSNPNASHIENIGGFIEAVEIDLRSNLEKIYFPKVRDVSCSLRKEPRPAGLPGMGMGMNPMMIGGLNQALAARSNLKKTTLK